MTLLFRGANPAPCRPCIVVPTPHKESVTYSTMNGPVGQSQLENSTDKNISAFTRIQPPMTAMNGAINGSSDIENTPHNMYGVDSNNVAIQQPRLLNYFKPSHGGTADRERGRGVGKSVGVRVGCCECVKQCSVKCDHCESGVCGDCCRLCVSCQRIFCSSCSTLK